MAKVIILEDIDFEWDAKDIHKVLILWHQGAHLVDIAKFINRSPEETFLLLMHLAKKGKIKERENYIWGTKSYEDKGEGRKGTGAVQQRTKRKGSHK